MPSRCGCARRMPAHDFMPQSGRMALWQMPDDIRVEHALQSGSEIPPFYDSMIAKIISHGATRDEARRQADSRARADRGVRRHHQSGVSRSPACGIPALPRARRPRRSSASIATNCWRRAPMQLGSARWRRCCSMSPIPMRRRGAAADRWRRRFRFRVRIELDRRQSMRSKSCASATAAMSQASTAREHRFEIDELDGDTIRFRRDGLMESARFLRDGDRLYILHRGVTIAVRDLTLAAPASRGGKRRRRQGPRGDERPRRRGAGQAGRAGRGRPAGDDAGGDEDGARAYGRRSPARCRRSMSPKASR